MNAMTLSRVIDAIELILFRRRNWVVALFGLITLLLLMGSFMRLNFSWKD